MKPDSMRRALLALCTAAAVLPAAAQEFPSKPIRIIAPQAAGGPNDVLGRLLAEKMTVALNQQVLVENKPGAGGMLAAQEVARAAPDGYTVLLITASLVSSAHLLPNAPVDPLKDLLPVSMVTFTPLVLAANTKLLPDVNSFQELLAYAKAHPGKLNIGVSGAGSADHLAAEMINRRAGVTIQPVIYKGAAPATQDLIGGRVELEITTYAFLRPYIENGTLRVLASPGKTRNPFVPNVPTISELGFPELDVPTWTGFMGTAFRQAMLAPEVSGRLADLSLVANYADADQFGATLRHDSARMKKVIQEANIKIH
jgi:tripartite-type tricarboxylate transporter receptor subunit TctC